MLIKIINKYFIKMEKDVDEVKNLFKEGGNDIENVDKRKNMFEQSEEFHESNDEENYPKQSKVLEDPEEYSHLKEIVSSFYNYQVIILFNKVDSLKDVSRMERDFNSLSESHRNRLKYNPADRIDSLKKAIFKNYLFLLKIAQPYKNMFKFFTAVNILLKQKTGEIFMEPLRVSSKNIVKMRSTLKLFIRDWAKEVNIHLT
jgi:hypothetical protein